MNNVEIKFLNSGNEINLSQLTFNKRKKVELKTLNKLSSENRNQLINYLYEINTDKAVLNILENQIKDSIIYHQIFLNANLPPKVDIEIVRTKKTEQFEHYLRKDNKYYFKTIQELFISKQSKNKKNQQDKISGESIQKYVLKENIPKLRIAIDFAKEFDYKNPPLIFDKFLTELRKSIPTSVENKNIEKSNKIIIELIVLHELAHIILDEKINQTYFKAAYELKDKQYDGKAIKQFVRLIHENFADGMAIYLGNIHYFNSNVINHYKEARSTTKNNTEGLNILNIYETIETIKQIERIKDIPQEYFIENLFKISLENSFVQLDNKLKNSKDFSSLFIKDLIYLEEKKCLNIDMDNMMESLKKNILEQLNRPLPIKEILLNEKIIESKKQVFKNIELLKNKFDHKSNENNVKI